MNLKVVRVVWILAAGLAFTGCNCDGSPGTDAVPGADAVTGADATSTDAAVVDAGTPDSGSAPLVNRRLLMVVDRSAVMQCLDEGSWRTSLGADLLDFPFAAFPRSAVGLIGFNDAIDVSDNTGDGIADFIFDPASDPAFTGVLARLGDAEGFASYEGALIAAFNAVYFELLGESWGGVVFEDWVFQVFVLGGGLPSPVCTLMSDPEPMCDTARMDWPSIGLDPFDPNLFFGFQDFAAYNQTTDILAVVDDLLALGPMYSTPEFTVTVEVNAVMVYPQPFAPMSAACAGWEAANGLDYAASETLMNAIATRGLGTYVPGSNYGILIPWSSFF